MMSATDFARERIAEGYRLILNHRSCKCGFSRNGDVVPWDYVAGCEAVASHGLPLEAVIVIGEEEYGKAPLRPVVAPAQQGAIMNFPLDQIRDNPYQARLVHDDARLESLTRSIRALGLLQLPVGRLADDGQAELAFGMSRLRAFRRLVVEDEAFAVMPVLVLELTDAQLAIMAWDENAERDDLTCIEEATFIQRMIDSFNWTHRQAAAYLGLARSTVSNKLRLLKLPEDVRQKLLRRKISERQAIAILQGISDGGDALSPREQDRLRRAAEKAMRGTSSDALRLRPGHRIARPGKLEELSRSFTAEARGAALYAVSKIRDQVENLNHYRNGLRHYENPAADDVFHALRLMRGARTCLERAAKKLSKEVSR